MPIPLLNNLPKCPYAKAALIKNKVKFVVSTDAISDVKKLVDDWGQLEVAVIIITNEITGVELVELTEKLNTEYVPQNFIFLEDHVDLPEVMQGVTFNNGRYNCIFMQQKSKLDEATLALEKLGYYKNWDKEYYDDVVGWRLDRT